MLIAESCVFFQVSVGLLGRPAFLLWISNINRPMCLSLTFVNCICFWGVLSFYTSLYLDKGFLFFSMDNSSLLLLRTRTPEVLQLTYIKWMPLLFFSDKFCIRHGFWQSLALHCWSSVNLTIKQQWMVSNWPYFCLVRFFYASPWLWLSCKFNFFILDFDIEFLSPLKDSITTTTLSLLAGSLGAEPLHLRNHQFKE